MDPTDTELAAAAAGMAVGFLAGIGVGSRTVSGIWRRTLADVDARRGRDTPPAESSTIDAP